MNTKRDQPWLVSFLFSTKFALRQRSVIRVMIHEQYFYPDYVRYQPEFEEKLKATFSFFREQGYQSEFFEDLLPSPT